MRIEKKKWIALLVALPLSQASAYQSGLEFLGPLFIGFTVTGVAASMTGGGLLLANTDRAALPIAASVLLVGGVASTVTVAKVHKELVNQLKVDHDTYVAGGEMTPILQDLYREVRSRSQELQLKDGPCVGGEIDELKMTEAIDKLLAMTESNAP